MTFLGVLVTHPGQRCTHLPLVIYILKKKKGEKTVAGNYITQLVMCDIISNNLFLQWIGFFQILSIPTTVWKMNYVCRSFKSSQKIQDQTTLSHLCCNKSLSYEDSDITSTNMWSFPGQSTFLLKRAKPNSSQN